MQTYTVLNIFRTTEQAPSFILSVYGTTHEYYRIDKSLSERVSHGMVFIGDKIYIKETTLDGVIFDVVPNNTESLAINTESEIDFFYLESKRTIHPVANPKLHYLPYLCDVLPYSDIPVKEIEASPIYKNDVFTGKYQVDLLEVSNIKIPLPGQFVAKILQKTRINTYPTVFNPFFFIIVSSNDILLKVVFWSESLRAYSSLKVGDIVMIKDYRMKKKWSAVEKIEFNTFTESVYFDVDEITAKEIVKVKFDKKAPMKYLFNIVEGIVEYLSVLMRYNCNGTLLEYVLMKLDGKCVVLFYNSDSQFYNIATGCKLKITELRKIQRAGFDAYVSTIYTQFEVTKMQKEDFQNKKIRKADSTPEIFGAIGFLPDNFRSISEVLDYERKETIIEREFSVNLFMKPTCISVSELKKQQLVLNETKKFIVSCKITKILDVECVVDYVLDGENMKQGSFAVLLDDEVEVFVYENFFNTKENDYPLLSFKDKKESIEGKVQNIVIEAFRVDESSILYYLTGIIHE